MKPKISMTDFIQYVNKQGASKQAKVRQLLKRDAYHPQMDFYKKLRESIVELHKSKKPKQSLKRILKEITDVKKQGKYPDLIDRYLRFLGRKKPEWFTPPRGNWEHGGLTVRLNPELGLSFNGKHHVIKVHFSSNEISKREADLVLTLMKKLHVEEPENTVFCLLDLKKQKLYTSDKIRQDLNPILEGEALSFVFIWNRFNKKAA